MQLLEQRLAAIRAMPPLLPKPDRQKANIKQVTGGGYLRLNDTVYRVETRHRYADAEGYEWFELVLLSLNDCRQYYLEWEEDDELEVSFTVRELSLSDLGLASSDLDRFDDEEQGQFSYDGVSYIYDESDKARFFKDGGAEGEELYYWDFTDKAKQKFVSVERWRNKWQAWLSVPVAPATIEILHTGAV